ncbi:MAG: hypothetical protein Q7U98_12970 [Methylicorpusculum sp.]|uniref:hypothetical protein n=1 Tax=Methylicorpusculum sp. TaxID=2713644 RepID=UPI0027211A1E|nr:hypothetical protein [Methylicorpusculum sp.]MDO8845405.1 hypothetical protein [Methylicorpusculum sp.]MDO8940063.1 hypothetical protein [Methylicorpusculum sp.]MDP2201444.1 hypothetical protein [Methylicorpusculum sp.]
MTDKARIFVLTELKEFSCLNVLSPRLSYKVSLKYPSNFHKTNIKISSNSIDDFFSGVKKYDVLGVDELFVLEEKVSSRNYWLLIDGFWDV